MPSASVFKSRLARVFGSIILVALSARGATAAPPFVYVLKEVSGAPNQIYGFTIDQATGALTPIAGFPVASGGIGGASTTSKRLTYVKNRLYVINSGDNTLSVFIVSAASGVLMPLPFSPISLGAGPVGAFWNCVAVHPSGSPVVVGESISGIIRSFVTTLTFAQAAGSPYTTGSALPLDCTFSQNGNYVYAGGLGGVTIAGLRNSGGGVLTPLVGSPFNSGGPTPLGYATDSSGRIFTADGVVNGNQVGAFTTSSGAPTPVAGNPFSAGGLVRAVHGVLHPAGFYMVADYQATGQVGVYQISGIGSATMLTNVSGSPFATGGIGTKALALTPNGSFLVAANLVTQNLTVFGVNAGTGGLSTVLVQPPFALGAVGFVSGLAIGVPDRAVTGDVDGDRKSDMTVFRPATGAWHTLRSNLGYTTSHSLSWGIGTDVPVPGDYDGDGQIDPAVFRPATTGWYVLQSITGYTTSTAVNWGASTDVPVPGDYDGDGKTDPAVFRPATKGWYFLKSSSGYTSSGAIIWGAGTDTPVQGDYDGDGITDPAVFRPSTVGWYFLMSSTNFTSSGAVTWGAATDIAAPGDYDGDGKTDPAVFRPATVGWYFLKSSTNYASSGAVSWGASTDTPVPADYDGDGKTDPAVFRPATGGWYVLKSSLNYTGSFGVVWGVGTDKPINGRP